MRLRTTVSTLLLSCAALLSAPLCAQGVADGQGMTPLPAPPGPYISSRPTLEPGGGGGRAPLPANMPLLPMPTAPMQYIPRPQQFPAPPVRWRGPMGGY
jgi:hypothetical protein